jgi:hypothetical protein
LPRIQLAAHFGLYCSASSAQLRRALIDLCYQHIEKMHYQLRVSSHKERLIEILFDENFSFIEFESVKYF